MVRTHEISPFLGTPMPVEFVAKLVAVEVVGSSVIMACETERHAPEMQDYYGTLCETVLAPPTVGTPSTVRLDFWTPTIIRLRYSAGSDVPTTPVLPIIGGEGAISPMLIGAPDDQVALHMQETADEVTITTAAVTLTITKNPWQLTLRGEAGKILWSTKPVDIDGLRRPRNQWNPPEQRWLFLHRYAYPLGRVCGRDQNTVFASFDLRHDEKIVGFGEAFGRFDKVGTSQMLWLQEAFGNASPASYKQVPFYISNYGHAAFVHTSNAVRFDVGSREHTAMSVTVEDADALDMFIIAGQPTEILPRYTSLTGAPAVPPPWSFGFWLGRITYDSQDQVEAVAKELRERRIPTDVIHIDTGWFQKDYTCDLTFSPTRFPDPAGMMARLREQGIRVCLWQWPNYNVASPLFDEGVAGGYLAKRTSGHAFTFPGGYGQDAGMIDFSNPDAVQWYQEKLAALFALGVASIKVDYGEGAVPSATYANIASHSMRNLYPLLYQDAVWQASLRAGREDAVIWARAGWAGSQRYPVHWSGDGIARFEDLPCVLRGMLSMGLSGFCFYSHDVGGFSGNPSPELYIRWLQLGVFSSHVRAHGSPPREPWEYGSHAEQITRRYLNLRYRLMPYLFTAAVEGARQSLPVARPLILDSPADPVCWNIDDVYLFGPDVVVAPIMQEGATSRTAYLPPGDWLNFWTEEAIRGGAFAIVEADLETLPLFVRSGSMIPMGPEQQWVGEHPCDPLELHFWGPTAGGEQAVHVAADQIVQVQWKTVDDKLEVDTVGAPGSVEIVMHPGRV